jgi:hypothetical protein
MQSSSALRVGLQKLFLTHEPLYTSGVSENPIFVRSVIASTLFAMATTLRAYPMQVRWTAFALAVPISFYVSCFGAVFMGLCPGIECWPHTFAWILITPCLLLAIWSLRATAIAAVLLLFAHIYTDIHVYKEGLSANTLWGTDKALDKCLWIVVFLLTVSASLPRRFASKGQNSH